MMSQYHVMDKMSTLATLVEGRKCGNSIDQLSSPLQMLAGCKAHALTISKHVNRSYCPFDLTRKDDFCLAFYFK